MTAPEPLAWLDALADTHSKATERPWEVDDDGVTVEVVGGDGWSVRNKYGFHAANAAAIVAAHNALPVLLRLARERYALEAAVLALAEKLDGEAAERDRIAERLPNTPSYRMEINRLLVAAKHQARAARRIRSTVTAALAGPHTADEEDDRG
jgi:hypothetical protein